MEKIQTLPLPRRCIAVLTSLPTPTIEQSTVSSILEIDVDLSNTLGHGYLKLKVRS